MIIVLGPFHRLVELAIKLDEPRLRWRRRLQRRLRPSRQLRGRTLRFLFGRQPLCPALDSSSNASIASSWPTRVLHRTVLCRSFTLTQLFVRFGAGRARRHGCRPPVELSGPQDHVPEHSRRSQAKGRIPKPECIPRFQGTSFRPPYRNRRMKLSVFGGSSA